MTPKFVIEADGGSRGNPGTAGSGAVIIDAESGAVLVEIARYIGVATNNVAEYVALLAGLQAAFELDSAASIEVRMDSKLVIEQMSGRWKIKHPDMLELGKQVQALVRSKQVTFTWIPRELNSRADALANKAMDEMTDSALYASASSSASAVQISASITEFNAEAPSSVRAPATRGEPLTTFILVRHGRTALTESRKISGGDGDDPELSAAGIADAKAVAKALKAIGHIGSWQKIAPISTVIASPMLRTRQTAQIVADEFGLSISENENLREIGFGDWDGLTHEQAEALDPIAWQAWRGSLTQAPPNGESLEAFDARLLRAKAEIEAQHAGKTVVIVAHVMPIRGFLKWAFDASVAAYWRPQIAPCSITILRSWGDSAAEVVTVNHTAHL